MPTYVSLISWTDQGVKSARETTKRAEQAKAAARKLGGKLTTVLWTQGRYDLIAITEFPDEESGMAYLLALGGQGNLRTETLRAYSAADMERIFAKMGDGAAGTTGGSSGSAASGGSKSARR